MNAQGKREPNKLKRDLNSGKVCIGATITMSNPVVAEIMSHIGFDWLWFEMEHTAMSIESVLSMLQATNGSDVSTVVRVPWNDKTMIKRVLDTGPDGIIIPLVNTKEEAELAVKAIKYPPIGERGAGLARAQCYGMHMGEYLGTANENIDEILTVKGVDSVMVGALDLSGSMGILGQTGDERVENAIQKTLEACKRAKIPCGIVAGSPEVANKRIKEGFQNIILGLDVLYLISAAQNALNQVVKTP